jgi:ribosomal protein S18 acetylase RimI-like enzyme
VVVVEVSPIRSSEVPAAVRVLARGMRDNPIHVAALGDDPERRVRMLTRMFDGLFRHMDNAPIVARRDGEVVGVLGIADSPACMPSPSQMLRLAPAFVRSGPVTTMRVARWMKAWQARDPAQPHSHLGPVAVDAGLQRQGIGSQMMASYRDILDDREQLGYLETDKAGNVAFYELSGFETVGQANVLGVPNWFMRREPERRPSA